jgi:hypothetical protein
MKDAQTQTEQINLRLTPSDLAELDALASELGLNRSNMLRFLVREKTRAIAASAGARLPLVTTKRGARA